MPPSALPRLDFQLQSGDLNPFLSAVSAHLAYWSCPDTALFIQRAAGMLAEGRQGSAPNES